MSNDIEDILLETFCSNFVAYTRAHAAHANITGRNFYSDHKLLEKVYEDLQDQIDTLAELLRTINGTMPSFLNGIANMSRVNDLPVSGSSDEFLESVCDDLEVLIEVYTELKNQAESDYTQIANYAQDRLLTLNKFVWMLHSTVGLDSDD